MKQEHWPARLDAAIEAARARRFAWGEHDCCLWAANVVRELTGVDFATDFRGTYADARGAMARLVAGGGVELIATEALGVPIAAARAQRGDVVLIDTEGRTALGICIGEAAAAPGEAGLVFVPMAQWIKAWRV